MGTADAVLEFLDEAAQSDKFPMLDNGYVYLGRTRLSLHSSPSEWALVIEVFGYSPRAGLPDLAVYTLASRLYDPQHDARIPPEHRLPGYPHGEVDFFERFEDDGWTDDEERVAGGVSHVVVRGQRVGLPPASAYAAHGIDLEEPPHVGVMEATRYLAAVHPDLVLATREERRTRVAPDLRELLVLDEWRHPRVPDELPSHVEGFRRFAEVLETGDAGRYRPTEPPNTHWRHWPEGGTL